MALNTLRLILFVGLLLVGNISYADEKTKTSKEANGFNAGNNDPKSEANSRYRSPPGIVSPPHNGSKPPPISDKERIEILEKIIQDQQKLIEMYRRQNNH